VFTLQWLADGAAILFWFAYDAQGNPFWAAGLGQYDNGKAVFPQLDSVSGGRFGEDYPAEQATLVPWGSLELDLSCEGATATYAATAEGFGSGSFDLKPLTKLAKPACPWVKPKLTDLYELEWVELPVEYQGNSVLRNVKASVVANDGAVFGTRQNADFAPVTGTEIVRFKPGNSGWEVLGTAGEAVTREVKYVAPDGSAVYAQRTLDGGIRSIEVWREVSGWKPLPGAQDAIGLRLTGMSQNGQWLVGTSTRGGRGIAWKWSEAAGLIELPFSETVRYGVPEAISNNGEFVVGSVDVSFVYEPVPGEGEIGTPPPPAVLTPLAIQWRDGNALEWFLPSDYPSNPSYNRPHTCNADCSVIFGFGSGELPYASLPPESPAAWFWTASGRVELLDAPVVPDEDRGIDLVLSYTSGVGGDGSIAFGPYSALRNTESVNAFDVVAQDVWLWTQYTGSVDLRVLLKEQFGAQTLEWEEREIEHVSADGRSILLTGYQPNYGDGSYRRPRAALLRLTPKPQD